MDLKLYDPDWGLIQAMAAGDISALDALYVKYSPALLGFLINRTGDRQLAEEILQDVMLSAWQSASTFRLESKVKTWLLVIARNKAVNAHRRKQINEIGLNDEVEMHNHDTSPLERVMRKSEQTSVREAISHLPAQHKEILVLVFYHQLSGPEIAEVLDISIGTVKSRLHRAKAMLRRVLLQEGEQ